MHNFNQPIVIDSLTDYLNALLENALDKKASDIHFEPFLDFYRIRMRRDGLLVEVDNVPFDFALSIVAKLKILANLNIAEKRLPQDGRLHINHFSKLDIRLNTCPTLHGEKLVLRLLNATPIALDISKLGMNVQQEQLFRHALEKPQGLILVTGPTGSGKTFTLYSALNYLNKSSKNIATVEDPVEIQLEGINQVNINPKIGLDFSTVLRTLLRQDPDILMIGEIRDAETAKIAIQAAETGHLVLSTLHANNAHQSLSRLYSLGLDPNHVNQSVSCIIAQRLIRKLCLSCKLKNTNHCNTKIKEHSSPSCTCMQGYLGQTGIFECLSFPDSETPYILLRDAAKEKLAAGITNIEEINRVLGYEKN